MPFNWDPYKQTIRDLYQNPNKTLKDVVCYMEKHHRLGKNRRQYQGIIKRWGFRKNARADEWKAIHHTIKSRRKRGKATVVYRDGWLVSREKLVKESRHDVPTSIEQYAYASSPQTPDGFIVCTPLVSEPPSILLSNLPSVRLLNHLLSLFEADQNTEGHGSISQNQDHTSQLPTWTLPSVTFGNFAQVLTRNVYDVFLAAIEPNNGITSILDHADYEEGNLRHLPRNLQGSAFIDSIYTVLHLASNNKLDETQAQAMLELFNQNGGRLLLKSLLAPGLPASKSLAGRLLFTAIRKGDIEIVKALMIHRGRNPDMAIYGTGTSPLNSAIEMLKPEIVSYLLEVGAKSPPLYPYITHFSCLGGAAKLHSRQILQILLSYGADVNATSSPENGSLTALHLAARSGCAEIVEDLLQAGANIDAAGNGQPMIGTTALNQAIKDNNYHMVQLLLNYGANVNAVHSRFGNPALSLAAGTGTSLIFHLLLEHGANLDGTSIDLVLIWAASGGNVQIIQFLLGLGANANAQNVDCLTKTALQAAVNKNHWDIVEILIKHGADVNASAIDEVGYTALYEAVATQNLDMICLLLHHGADVHARSGEGFTVLQEAACGGRLDIVELLLHYGADVNAPAAEEHGLTALQAATKRSSFDIVQLLLSRGANVHAHPSMEGGYTALQAAVTEADQPIELASLFINQYGADVNMPGSPRLGMTALQSAAGSGHLEAVQLLLRHGADVNAPASLDGFTALQAAMGLKTQATCLAIVRVLLDAGADLKSVYPEDMLFGGDSQKATEMALALLNAGLDPNKRKSEAALFDHSSNSLSDDEDAVFMRNGWTLLQFAAELGNGQFARILLELGADVNACAVQSYGRTALQAAAETEKVDLVRLLLDWGAEINAEPCPRFGVTALQSAASIGNIEIISLLIEKGADVNAPAARWQGRTALEAAAEHGRLDTVQLLLNMGAQTAGSRAIEFATEVGHDGVVALLEAYET